MDVQHTSKLRLAFFFFIQSLCWIVAHLLFRFKVHGLDNIPTDGSCILACNHVSFVDWLLIAAVNPRPIRFVMYVGFFSKLPMFSWLFKGVEIIPICSKKENPDVYRDAFNQISYHLNHNRMVGIFPEGTLTQDGTMLPFRHGIDKIIKRDPVTVVPAKLSYSLFGHWSTRSPEKFAPWQRPKVDLIFGQKIEASQVNALYLEDIIRNMAPGV